MKELSLLVLGVFIGYLGYPQVQAWREAKAAPAPEIVSAPVMEPTPAMQKTPARRYENPLDRGAYDQRNGVASSAIIVSGARVYQTPVPAATPPSTIDAKLPQ